MLGSAEGGEIETGELGGGLEEGALWVGEEDVSCEQRVERRRGRAKAGSASRAGRGMKRIERKGKGREETHVRSGITR